MSKSKLFRSNLCWSIGILQLYLLYFVHITAFLQPNLPFQHRCFRPFVSKGTIVLPAKGNRRLSLLSLNMGNGFQGQLSIASARNFGETFFFKAEYSGEGVSSPRQWNFRRTWSDFVDLDSALRKDQQFMQMAGGKLKPVPDQPYLIGDKADSVPFQRYLDSILSIPGAFGVPAVYTFFETPNAVLVAAFPNRVPIDVDVVGASPRYEGKTSKYAVPPLDPVILAEQAGRTVRDVKVALTEADIARNAGAEAAKVRREADKVVQEVTKVVNAKSTGQVLGSVIGNLRSGKGLFGEQATKAFTDTVITAVAGDATPSDEEAAAAAAPSPSAAATAAAAKWTLTIVGPDGAEPIEVTVRPQQPARLLLQVWLRENGVDPASPAAAGFALACGAGGAVDAAAEIGAAGLADGGRVMVVRL